MKLKLVIQRDSWEETLTPPEPNSEQVSIRVAQRQLRWRLALSPLTPVEPDSQNEERVLSPLFPEGLGLGTPPFAALAPVLLDLSAGQDDSPLSLSESERTGAHAATPFRGVV
jgi:hypothetical protein